MNTRWLLIASLAVAALMAGFAFYIAGQVAAGTQLATHFDAAGQPDRYRDVLPALLMPAGVLAGISLLFAAVPFIEPLQDKLEGSSELLRVSWIGMTCLMVFVQLVIAAPAYGWQLPPQFVLSGVGVLFVVLGNWLPKSRPGFFVGIRTPWTITDTDIWIATHRLAGKLMMLAGALLVVVPLLLMQTGVDGIRFLVPTVVIAVALIPTVYSWWLWHRKKRGA